MDWREHSHDSKTTGKWQSLRRCAHCVSSQEARLRTGDWCQDPDGTPSLDVSSKWPRITRFELAMPRLIAVKASGRNIVASCPLRYIAGRTKWYQPIGEAIARLGAAA